MNINYSGFANTIREIVRTSIEDNFKENGRFGKGLFGGGSEKWKPSRRAEEQGGKSLQDSGQLAASIQVKVEATGGLSIDENGVLQNNGEINIKIGSNKTTKDGHNLAAIHQLGAKPKITSKSRKFFLAMFCESGDTFWLGLARTKKKEFVIPARPFLVLQDADVKKISERFVQFLSGS